MSRIITALGLSLTLLAACTWADCKKDAQATSEAFADCGPDIAPHIVDGIHQGAAGVLGDVFNAVQDGFCVARAIKAHLATDHAECADAGASCIVSAANEQKLIDAALAIEKAIKAKRASK